MSKIQKTLLNLIAIILFAVTSSFAQNAQPFKSFFNSLNMDPVVTVKNNGKMLQNGVKIFYKINGQYYGSEVFTCVIKPDEEITVQLKRYRVDNVATFDSWLSSVDDKPCDTLITITSVSILLSKRAIEEKEQSSQEELVEAYIKPVNGQINGINFFLSAFLDDYGKAVAFLSGDKGTLWVQAPSSNIRGAEKNVTEKPIPTKPFLWTLTGIKEEAVKKEEANNKTIKLFLTEKVVSKKESVAYMDKELSSNDCNIIQLSGVSAYPNPFQNNLTIEYSATGNMPIYLSLINSSGQKMLQFLNGAIMPIGKNKIEYNTAKLPAGTYFLKFVSNSKEQTIKIVKQ